MSQIAEYVSKTTLAATVCFSLLCTSRAADALEAALQAKLDAQLKAVQALAAEPAVVKAVKEHNTSVPAEQAAMTNEKWKTLSVLDPFVRAFTKNDAALALKTKKTAAMSEGFLSDAAGLKVAFLAKTTFWCHKGKAKHDVPMTGSTWQGTVEVDESTGVQQIQIAAPVLEGNKPIGSLVVGLSLASLQKE